MHTQKAAYKNLLFKLNINWIDYKILKRRLYCLNFTFLFLDVQNVLDNNICLDIGSKVEDSINLFIILNGFYMYFFNDIIYYYNNFLKNKYKKYNSVDLIEMSEFENLFDLDFNKILLKEGVNYIKDIKLINLSKKRDRDRDY